MMYKAYTSMGSSPSYVHGVSSATVSWDGTRIFTVVYNVNIAHLLDVLIIHSKPIKVRIIYVINNFFFAGNFI